jgi:hypothetical protein
VHGAHHQVAETGQPITEKEKNREKERNDHMMRILQDWSWLGEEKCKR